MKGGIKMKNKKTQGEDSGTKALGLIVIVLAMVVLGMFFLMVNEKEKKVTELTYDKCVQYANGYAFHYKFGNSEQWTQEELNGFLVSYNLLIKRCLDLQE